MEVSERAATVRRMHDLQGSIRRVAEQVGEEHFLEILRWHLVVSGLPDVDPYSRGAYRTALAALGEARATELLHDLSRLARDPRKYKYGLDGKPRYLNGQTLGRHHGHP